MCRMYIDKTDHQSMQAYAKHLGDLFGYDACVPPKPWRIATTDTARVLRRLRSGSDAGFGVALMRWGLVPPWAKELKFGVQCVNARAESVAEKPAFRDAFQARRCLVPASCWVEWREEGGIKQPYRLEQGNGAPLLFAGLWERWRPRDGGDWVETFAILTGEPNAYAAQVHDRSPVVLDPDHVAAWCDAPPAAARQLLKPYGGTLVARPIHRDIGSSKQATAEAIEAIGPALA